MLPGAILLGDLLPGADAALMFDLQPVDLRTPRTATFVTTGHSRATFERPSTSASFEQAEAFVVRP